MTEVLIRGARPGDRNHVLEWTRKTFSWGDYIGRRYGAWLRDKLGRLMVAEMEDEVVGLVFVKNIREGEAWVQGLRVHPDHRREGIGSALMKECITAAEKMGAKTIRLATYETNSPAQALFSSLGFTQVTMFALMRRKAEKIRDAPLLQNVNLAGEQSAQRIWSHIRGSPSYRQSGGLYTILFVWYDLGEQELRRFVSKGRAAVYSENDSIHGVMLIDNSMIKAWNRKGLQSCYVDYDSTEAALKLVRFLLDHAARKRLKTVDLWMHFDKTVLESMEGIGFRIDDEEPSELVYAKELSRRLT